ncbi:MAG TPA: hypothetical protein VHS06_10310 [Chloroflexota bacterium]|nr:hypothetical protein [Chloroflexota bacterium]
MQKVMNDRDRKGGTWIWQAASGLGLLLLLGLHMIAQHFVAAGGLRSFQDVLAYIRTPVVMLLEVAFLIVVTYHALLGVRAVVADLGFARRREDTVNRVLTVIGVLVVAYGLYLTWYLALRV